MSENETEKEDQGEGQRGPTGDPPDQSGGKERDDRRQGDSPRAKFYRWKDQVFQDAFKSYIARKASGKTEPDGSNSSVLLETREAMKALDEAPDSLEAYVKACEAVRAFADALRKSGVEMPDFTEPPAL